MKFLPVAAALFLCSAAPALPAGSASPRAARARAADKGLNLPPTQGITRDGAFFPGVYSYSYDPEQVAWVVGGTGFSAVRLAINLRSADDGPTLRRHQRYIDAMGGRGIICFFEPSSAPNTSSQRAGRVTNVTALARMWRKVHGVFAPYGEHVMYEIFNEPWGYSADAASYLSDMRAVIDLAGLPSERVMLAGLYGSADVQSVAAAGWQGSLAYHVYGFYLPEGQRTRSEFSNRIQQDLSGLGSRVYITEFGTGLNGLRSDPMQAEAARDVVKAHGQDAVVDDWLREHGGNSNDKLDDPTKLVDTARICQKYPGNSWCRRWSRSLGLLTTHEGRGGGGTDPAEWQRQTEAFLSGMHDALLALKAQGQNVRGLYHWHGWHNSDSWDFWDSSNAVSSRMIQQMMADVAEQEVGVETPAWQGNMWSDYVTDDQTVHVLAITSLVPAPSTPCPEACGGGQCQDGNSALVSGHLVRADGVCTDNCSRPYEGVRYCGAGKGYDCAGAVDCSACARPAACQGLPCWRRPASRSETTAPPAAHSGARGARGAPAGASAGAAAATARRREYDAVARRVAEQAARGGARARAGAAAAGGGAVVAAQRLRSHADRAPRSAPGA